MDWLIILHQRVKKSLVDSIDLIIVDVICQVTQVTMHTGQNLLFVQLFHPLQLLHF